MHNRIHTLHQRVDKHSVTYVTVAEGVVWIFFNRDEVLKVPSVGKLVHVNNRVVWVLLKPVKNKIRADLIKKAEVIPNPKDYFQGLPSSSVIVPENILLFYRTSLLPK